MVHFTTTFVAAIAAGAVNAFPLTDIRPRTATPNAQGTSGGFFYQFWDDGNGGDVQYTNGDAGE